MKVNDYFISTLQLVGKNIRKVAMPGLHTCFAWNGKLNEIKLTPTRPLYFFHTMRRWWAPFNLQTSTQLKQQQTTGPEWVVPPIRFVLYLLSELLFFLMFPFAKVHVNSCPHYALLEKCFSYFIAYVTNQVCIANGQNDCTLVVYYAVVSVKKGPLKTPNLTE